MSYVGLSLSCFIDLVLVPLMATVPPNVQTTYQREADQFLVWFDLARFFIFCFCHSGLARRSAPLAPMAISFRVARAASGPIRRLKEWWCGEPLLLSFQAQKAVYTLKRRGTHVRGARELRTLVSHDEGNLAYWYLTTSRAQIIRMLVELFEPKRNPKKAT